jgi:hypothetical protein
MEDLKKKSDEDFVRKIQEYEGDYLSVDNDRLILFTVGILDLNRIEPTFDKIVVAAFRLFPKKFSLIGFPEYPDAKRINDCLLHCVHEPKKWLFGNAQSGYKITDRGRYYLDEAKKILEGKIKVTKKYAVFARRKELTFIRLLKKTSAFKKYEHGDKGSITEAEILEALRVDPNHKDLIIEHLIKYIDYAIKIQDSVAQDFLKFIKNKIKGDNNA